MRLLVSMRGSSAGSDTRFVRRLGGATGRGVVPKESPATSLMKMSKDSRLATSYNAVVA